jgi:phosphatidylglycerophosphatase A
MDFSWVGELGIRRFTFAFPRHLCCNPEAMQRVAILIATFFYAGKSPKAPGTAGSFVALPLAWWIWLQPTFVAWIATGALFLLGVWASHRVVKQSGKEDNQEIVIDEVVGVIVTASVAAHLWWHYALVFFFFRAFDIFKPGPVRWIDANVKGGLGAMVDDLAAALMAAATLYLVLQASAYMVAPAVA